MTTLEGFTEMNEVKPAAIVKAAKTVSDLAFELRGLFEKHKRDRLEIGKKLIALKDLAVRENKSWYEVLKTTEIPERSASDYMALVSKKDTAGSTSADSAGSGQAREVISCRECRILGAKNTCEKHKPMAAATKAETAEPVEPKAEEREPGADEQEDAILDSEGRPVPDIARAAFHAAKEVAAVCREVDGIKSKIEEKKGYPGWENVLLDSVSQALANARQVLYQSRATHVCPWCDGKGQSKKNVECQCCRGRGWTIKANYNAWARENNGAAK